MLVFAALLVLGIALFVATQQASAAGEGPQASPGVLDPTQDPGQVSDCTGNYYDPTSALYNPALDPCQGGMSVSQTNIARPGYVPASDWAIVVAAANGEAWLAYLLAAIGWHETQWGATGAGRDGFILGVGVPNDTTELSQFAGLQAQVSWAAPRLQSYLGGPPITADQLIAFSRDIYGNPNPTAWGTGVYAQYAANVGNAGLPGLAA